MITYKHHLFSHYTSSLLLSLLQLHIKTNLIGTAIYYINKKITQTHFILHTQRLLIEIVHDAALFYTISQLLDVGLGHQVENFVEVWGCWVFCLEDALHVGLLYAILY